MLIVQVLRSPTGAVAYLEFIGELPCCSVLDSISGVSGDEHSLFVQDEQQGGNSVTIHQRVKMLD